MKIVNAFGTLIMGLLMFIAFLAAAPFWIVGSVIGLPIAALIIMWDGFLASIRAAVTATGGEMSGRTTGGKSRFHDWLRKRLEEDGMTQSKLADELEIDKQFINNWLGGSDPSYKMLLEIKKKIGDEANQFLD